MRWEIPPMRWSITSEMAADAPSNLDDSLASPGDHLVNDNRRAPRAPLATRATGLDRLSQGRGMLQPYPTGYGLRPYRFPDLLGFLACAIQVTISGGIVRCDGMTVSASWLPGRAADVASGDPITVQASFRYGTIEGRAALPIAAATLHAE